MNVNQWLQSTKTREIGLLLLRIGIGLGLIYHGSGKLFGDMAGFVEGVARMGFPLPALFAWAAALSEFLGGIGILLGLFTRSAAIFVGCTMFTAAFIRHADDPFSHKEKALLYLLVALAFLIMGSGRISIDSWIRSRGSERTGRST